MNYNELNAQQLRVELELENCRIEGANKVRKTVQMYSCVIGFFGTPILLCLLKNHFSGVQCLALWLGCAIVYWRSNPKKKHYLHHEGWENEARIILRDAAYQRANSSAIEQKSKSDD
jgi:hypothetical protein